MADQRGKGATPVGALPQEDFGPDCSFRWELGHLAARPDVCSPFQLCKMCHKGKSVTKSKSFTTTTLLSKEHTVHTHYELCARLSDCRALHSADVTSALCEPWGASHSLCPSVTLSLYVHTHTQTQAHTQSHAAFPTRQSGRRQLMERLSAAVDGTAERLKYFLTFYSDAFKGRLGFVPVEEEEEDP